MDLNLVGEVGFDTYTNVIIANLTFPRSSRAFLLFTTPTYMVPIVLMGCLFGAQGHDRTFMVGRPGNDPGQCLDAGFTVQTPSLEVYRPLFMSEVMFTPFFTNSIYI